MFECSVCGNEIVSLDRICPWCGATCSLADSRGKLEDYCLINLKKGMPTVEQALLRFDNEFAQAVSCGYRVLVLIHGYGSTGVGGKIKKAVRARLDYLACRKEINMTVGGEEFFVNSGVGKDLIRRFPFLKKSNEFKKANPGITVVVL